MEQHETEMLVRKEPELCTEEKIDIVDQISIYKPGRDFLRKLIIGYIKSNVCQTWYVSWNKNPMLEFEENEERFFRSYINEKEYWKICYYLGSKTMADEIIRAILLKEYHEKFDEYQKNSEARKKEEAENAFAESVIKVALDGK